jgi:hypothetical protein
MRVTDEIVRGFLTWAKNYGEIESYERIASAGRKWRITLPTIATASGAPADDLTNYGSARVVPAEFVMTSREAVAFGYGLAVAGGRVETRATFAARKWGW